MFVINNNYKLYDTCIYRTQFVKDLEAFLVPKMFSCINMRTSFLSQLLGQIHNWPFSFLLYIVYCYSILYLVLNSSMLPLFAVFFYPDSNKLEPIQRKFKSFSSYPLWLHSWARVCRITNVMRFKATSWCSFASKSSWDQKIWRCLLDTNNLEFLYHNIVNFN